MPEGENRLFAYSYHREERGLHEAQSETSQTEDLRYIRETILMLTGGCEVCQYSVGPFCKKHGRPIELGDPRCEYFVRRFSEDPKRTSKDQVRKYINETLGIKDESRTSRLTGAA
ncbi:MAG TPA: hypothetical protein VGR53_10195 [Nitrososphaerales archaeon]|nr:hypothetical protein [Nitrososphaerales archaeon]